MFKFGGKLTHTAMQPVYQGLSPKPVVSIQGQPGSFHHIGARRLFGDVTFLYRDSFREVFEDAHAGRSNFQFIAIENSIAGSIIYNYDLLANSRIPIVAEKYLRIGQHLIAAPGVGLGDLREVWSHPMAIEQCRQFLSGLDVRVVEKVDTAGSVKEMRDTLRLDVGVISSDYSAELYGMNILQPHIETDPNNYTRFLLLSHESLPRPKNNGTYKTTLWFGVSHKPGGLVTLLQVFLNHQINMTKLESRPRVGSPWVYDFFADVHLDAESDAGQQIISEARQHCEFLHILGTYPDVSQPDQV